MRRFSLGLVVAGILLACSSPERKFRDGMGGAGGVVGVGDGGAKTSAAGMSTVGGQPGGRANLGDGGNGGTADAGDSGAAGDSGDAGAGTLPTGGSGGGLATCEPGTVGCNGAMQPKKCDENGVWRNQGSACGVCSICAPQTGTCGPADDGTTCDDQNGCTQSDSCQKGACKGANPITCVASDTCHTVGTCNPSSGICSNPNASDTTSCSSAVGMCSSGTCKVPIFTTFGRNSQATAVSGDGSVVVGSSPDLKSFRWTLATGMVALPLLANATECFVADVSSDGAYSVGQCTVANKRVPVRWKGTSAPINLAVPAPYDNAYAVAVNANGTVAVGSTSQGNSGGSAVVWVIGSTPTVLPYPTGFTSSSATRVSGDGNVVIGEAWNGNTQTFRWTSSGGTQLIPYAASGTYASAKDVNSDGSKILITDNDYRAHIWSNNAFSGVGTSTGVAIAMTSDGTTVLTSEPAITAGGVTQTLSAKLAAAGYDLGDWVFLSAADISANGKVILGSGYHNVPNTTYDGFMIVFP